MTVVTIQTLLIEDNPGDVRLIRELLKEASGDQFVLTHVDRLETALEYLGAEPTDVVLLDLGLPDAKGLETLVRVRETAPALPVVVLTGLDDEEAGIQAVGLGAQDFLVKGQVEAALLSRVLRYAIERKQAEKEMLAAQQLAQSTIDSLGNHICVLDESGTIISVNKSWTDFARNNGGDLSKVGQGVNYLTICEAAQGAEQAFARQFAQGIRSVMRGDSDLFEVEYPCHSPQEERWFVARVIPRHTSNMGTRTVIVSHENITERIHSQDALHQHHQYLLSLQKTSLDLVSQLDLDSLLENIVRRAGELVGASSGFLNIVDLETNQLIPKVGLGALAESLKFKVQPGQGLAGIVWQTGQPLVVNDYDNWPGRIHGFAENLLHSIIAVPLLVDSKVFGVLGLAHDADSKATFGPAIIDILNQFARLATVAIQNARLFSQVEQELFERKQAEKTLRLQSAALEAAANAIVITNINGNIQWANPAFTTLTGYTLTEAIGKNPRDLVKSGMYEKSFYKNMWDTILAGKVWHGEIINRRKDGNLFTEEQTITPLIDINGEISYFIGIKQDITGRKQAENDRVRLLTQVREQADRIRHIMDTVPQGIVLLDDSGQILMTNPVAERDMAVLAGQVGNGIVTHLGERSLTELLTGNDWHEVIVEGRTFLVIARPMEKTFDATNWVLAINDVTDQRTSQRYQQAQERLATVGQLAAGIAHDFNNVMSVIMLYTQLLQNIPDLSTKHQQHLTLISNQAHHAANLISQILDFSRRSDMEQQPLDILPLMKEFIQLLKHTLPENISLSLPYDQKKYVVNADPTRLQQAFMNLALNARDAMLNGGTLSFKLSLLKVTTPETSPLPDMEAGNWLNLAVSDTGTGIASENLSRIFDPFFTTKEVGKGTGLGLAQVYGIIKQHGGFIDVQSQIGEGTTFNIYLPLITESATDPLPKLMTDSVLIGTETILLVEDNAAMRLSVAETLTSAGYNVLLAAEGDEAQAILAGEGVEVDLILTDLVMPGMDGLQLIKAVHQNYPAIKFLIMSGHTLEKERFQALQETAVPWIQKPFTLEQLTQKIRPILDS